MTLPLVLLAIPSMIIGFYAIEPMLFGEWFKGVIYVADHHNVIEELAEEFHGPVAMAIHGMSSMPFFLAMSGVVVAWFFYMIEPAIPAGIQRTFSGLNTVLNNKYYFDKFNEVVFAGGARLIGRFLWRVGDVSLIDGVMVNGTAKLIGGIAALTRLLQTGHVYQYAFSMIIGVFLLMTFWFIR